MRKEWIFAIALSLTGGTAVAAMSFSDYDTDGNGQVSKDEFYGLVGDAGKYSDWDTNGDGLIDEDEFNALGYDWDYDTWDADGDGYVDSGEYYAGVYSYYDANEDGHWDNGEWDDAGNDGWIDV